MESMISPNAMEVLGGAAPGIVIYNQLETCTRGLHRLYRNFKFARKEVGQLMEEVSACQSLSEIFYDISRPLDTTVMKLVREKKLDNILKSQTSSAREQTDHIKAQLKPLMMGGKSGRFDQFLAKVCWHFTKHEGQALLATLGSVKHTLILLTCLLALDNSLARLSEPLTASQNYDSLVSQM